MDCRLPQAKQIFTMDQKEKTQTMYEIKLKDGTYQWVSNVNSSDVMQDTHKDKNPSPSITKKRKETDPYLWKNSKCERCGVLLSMQCDCGKIWLHEYLNNKHKKKRINNKKK